MPAQVADAFLLAIKKMMMQGKATLMTEVDRMRQQRWARMRRTRARPRHERKTTVKKLLKTSVDVTG